MADDDEYPVLEALECDCFLSFLLLVGFGFLLQGLVIVIFLIIHFFFGPELANKESKDEVLFDNYGEEEDNPNHHPDSKVAGG